MNDVCSAATVGMLDRREWIGGSQHTFAPGEVVIVRDTHLPVVVQSVGRPLPVFAAAGYVEWRPNFELILIYEAPWLEVRPIVAPDRLSNIAPQIRLVFCDTRLAAGLMQPDALPRTDVLISAEADDLALLAEAFALMFHGGNQIIGLDYADLLKVSGRDRAPIGCGRAIVMRGRGDASMAANLRAWIDASAQEGFDGGLLATQIFAEAESEQWELSDLSDFFDEALSGIGDRDAVVTASLFATQNAFVVVTFSKSTDPL